MESEAHMTAPTPTMLRVMRGNPAKRPLPVGEPAPTQFEQVPEPPAILGVAAEREWRRLAPELMRLGLLTVADIAMFTGYCQTFGRWYEAEELLKQGCDHPTVWLNVADKASREMRQYAGEFGLTPCSRTRLAGVDVAKPPSKFEGLLAR
jgi:P27 family predicted phage terminase small subunit